MGWGWPDHVTAPHRPVKTAQLSQDEGSVSKVSLSAIGCLHHLSFLCSICATLSWVLKCASRLFLTLPPCLKYLSGPWRLVGLLGPSSAAAPLRFPGRINRPLVCVLTALPISSLVLGHVLTWLSNKTVSPSAQKRAPTASLALHGGGLARDLA